MATKTKSRMKTCVHCGHTFDLNDPSRTLASPHWHPIASNYCSHECSDRFHCDMGHRCSAHIKDKARRDAAKAGSRT
jgi:hypothetical protein